MSTKFLSAALAVVLMAAFSAAPAFAAKKGFGCYLVTVDSLNVRERPYSNADVVGVVYKGDILIKRRLFCTLRGFWCAVRAGSMKGYVDKSYIQKITCP